MIELQALLLAVVYGCGRITVVVGGRDDPRLVKKKQYEKCLPEAFLQVQDEFTTLILRTG